MPRCIQGVVLQTLIAEFAGNAQAIYPQLALIGEPITFPINYILVGVQLSSSLVIFGTNKGGILLVVGQKRPKLTVSNSIQSIISHITNPNSLTGPPAIAVPTSKVTSLSFGAFGVPIPAGTPLSLYAFADGTSGNDLFAICSLQLIPIQ
jgi:hypothetical protein